MLLGFFGLIIAVNALFIFLALETWTGLVSDKAYIEDCPSTRRLRRAAGSPRLDGRSTWGS